jgi:hypothetical protein
MFLGVEPRLIQGLKSADVLITGNSRTIATFVTRDFDNQIDLYFQRKGLRHFMAAEEGSGFRFRKLLLEKLGANPKIALVNSDDFFADLLTDYTREIVFNQDRLRLPFQAANYAMRLQHFVCTLEPHQWSEAARLLLSGAVSRAQSFYCNGPIRTPAGRPATIWRNVDTGGYIIDSQRPPRDRRLIVPDVPDPYLGHIELFWRKAVVMFNSDVWKNTCIILYQIPGPGAHGGGVLREIARRLGVAYVYPEITAEKGYYVYDASHMDLDTAERWTAEFLPLLDPHIDRCLQRMRTQ